MLSPLLLAFSFLTRLPVLREKAYQQRDFGASFGWFPLVGAVVGGIAAAAGYGLVSAGSDPRIAAFAALLLLVLLTGALHLDGLADTADGLMSGKEPARALAIMKEPHTGPFGYTAIFLVLIGKFAALSVLFGEGRFAVAAAALAAARWAMVAAAYRARYPRTQGTGAAFIGHLTPLTLAAATAVMAAFAPLAGVGTMALFAAAALFIALALRAYAARRIGGVTGDILGAVNEVAETALLLIA